MTTTAHLSARDRLLAAADELFYAEGVHIVGIDRIIERAGVAKASLYSSFGSKEGLVEAYLRGRRERLEARTLEAIATRDQPREQILAIFDAQARAIASPGYRGCAFAAASAESPSGGVVEQVSDSYRAWLRGVFDGLCEQLGARDPRGLAAQLQVIYDGVTLQSRMDRTPAGCGAARSVVVTLLDAAV